MCRAAKDMSRQETLPSLQRHCARHDCCTSATSCRAGYQQHLHALARELPTDQLQVPKHHPLPMLRCTWRRESHAANATIHPRSPWRMPGTLVVAIVAHACAPRWLALIFSVFSCLISMRTFLFSLCCSSFAMPMPLSFHSPLSWSKRYSLVLLHTHAWRWQDGQQTCDRPALHDEARPFPRCSQDLARPEPVRSQDRSVAHHSNSRSSSSSPVLVSTSSSCTMGLNSAWHSSSGAAPSSPSSPSSPSAALAGAPKAGATGTPKVKPPVPLPKVAPPPSAAKGLLGFSCAHAAWVMASAPSCLSCAALWRCRRAHAPRWWSREPLPSLPTWCCSYNKLSGLVGGRAAGGDGGI